jgi:predicted nucleic acid-binding protein
MMVLVLDACAVARVYFEDIGTRNMLQIYNYPGSVLIVPNFAHCEAVSAMTSALNNHELDVTQYATAKGALAGDFHTGKVRTLLVEDDIVTLGIQLLEKHKVQPGRMALGGADVLYLALALNLSAQMRPFGIRTILVTSDKALYNSAVDEPDLEAFHFWTCDLGCGCTSIIPVKGQANSCPQCGQTCVLCRVDLCPSTYQVVF